MQKNRTHLRRDKKYIWRLISKAISKHMTFNLSWMDRGFVGLSIWANVHGRPSEQAATTIWVTNSGCWFPCNKCPPPLEKVKARLRNEKATDICNINGAALSWRWSTLPARLFTQDKLHNPLLMGRNASNACGLSESAAPSITWNGKGTLELAMYDGWDYYGLWICPYYLLNWMG